MTCSLSRRETMTLPVDLLWSFKEQTNWLAPILRRFLWMSGVSGDPHADRSRRTSRKSWAGTESVWIKASICLTAINIRMMSRTLCNGSQVKKPLHHRSDIPNWSKGHFIEDSSTNNTLKQIKDCQQRFLKRKNDRTLPPFGVRYGKIMCFFPVSFPLNHRRVQGSSVGSSVAMALPWRWTSLDAATRRSSGSW